LATTKNRRISSATKPFVELIGIPLVSGKEPFELIDIALANVIWTKKDLAGHRMSFSLKSAGWNAS
jgi:hypothetical protein